MEKNFIIEIRKNLQKAASAKSAKIQKRFFKGEVKLYGVKSVEIEKIAKKCLGEIKKWPKEKVFSICEKLWQSDYLEEELIACRFCYSKHKDFKPTDFKIFEGWINKYIKNWASCDTFCNHSVGDFLQMYPKYSAKLKIWARAKNLWLRRAAAVSLIVPVKKGLFLNDIFAIADILLKDKEDMVQKGYGWMLKVASQAHQEKVFKYIMKNKQLMPRTALRYAIEKMPANLRQKAMEK